MGNLIDYLLETSTQEIVDAAPFALSSFLLFDEEATDAVRQEQQQAIIIPLVERLRHRLGQVNLTVQLRRLLELAKARLMRANAAEPAQGQPRKARG